jgi:tripartite-type tricarboxylate transporter receptor subunit TctC
MTRRGAALAILVGLGLAAPAVAAVAAVAADWPVRPVRIIAPSSPGGAADTFARILADNLPEIFRERFYVDNRAGAGGLIGAIAAARAEPDGYTFVTSSVGYHVIAPAISANPGFDPIKDFVHIAYLGGPPNVLVVNPTLGVKTLEEFLAHARARAEPMLYVSPGIGSHGQLVSEYFAQLAGIKLQHVPHKGASPAMLDLIAGNVKVGTMTWTTAIAQIRAGQVIPLAVSSSARIPEFPDLPTFRERGYADLVTNTWYALSAPAGLPRDIVDRLAQAVPKIMALPQVREKLDRDAIETQTMSPEEVTAYMASETQKWGPIAKRVVPAN